MSRLNFKDVNSTEEKIDFGQMHKECRINLEATYKRPPLALSIGTDDYGNPIPFGTFGNISLIKGEEKTRKSFLKSLLLACAIGGSAVDYGEEIKGHGLHDKYILDLDGEQDDYYAWLNGIRIPRMVGTLPDNFETIKLREKSAKIRSQYLEWLFLESEYRNKLGLISIDGYVDFVRNFNDLEECAEFTQRLMKYSSLAQCHVTGVLHLNPGTTKARGHLGTILQQKCETVVSIRDGGEYSVVECQRARGKKFDDFTIRIDENWLPVVSNDPISNSSNTKDPF